MKLFTTLLAFLSFFSFSQLMAESNDPQGTYIVDSEATLAVMMQDEKLSQVGQQKLSSFISGRSRFSYEFLNDQLFLYKDGKKQADSFMKAPSTQADLSYKGDSSRNSEITLDITMNANKTIKIDNSKDPILSYFVWKAGQVELLKEETEANSGINNSIAIDPTIDEDFDF
ncbi:MAG: hypothetical protein HQL32_05440 [Planctomycetes bacterium]|nr:hypothetical protein [Planctomycetota bacterium]